MTIVLRSERSNTDTRYLSATLNQQGDLVFAGQDLGPGVKAIFGYSEYEWAWTVKAASLPAFAAALGHPQDLLQALEANFSGDNAAKLLDFMETHGIPHESWSRIGD